MTGLEIGNYVHKHLGVVMVDDACVHLQKTNPDSSSMFVVYEEDIREVSKQCVLKK